MAEAPPDLLPLYRSLAAETIEVALAKGTLEASAEDIRDLLSK